MKNISIRVIFFVVMAMSCAAGSAFAQRLDEIDSLQYTRSIADGKLYHYLSSQDADQRARAAVALANIQDSSSIPQLLPHLSDPDPFVRRNCAYALGQIGGAQAAAPLLAQIKREPDIRCREASFEALGKCGVQEDLRQLIIAAPSLPRMLQSAVCLCVARFAIRGVKDSTATEYVARFMEDRLAGAWSTYAFMRIADSAAVIRHLPTLLQNMANPSPDVRMWTASIIGRFAVPAGLNLLLQHTQKDQDWRVRVNAVRALPSYRPESTESVLLELTRGTDEHVALTAYSVLNGHARQYGNGRAVAAAKKALADSRVGFWRRRGEAALLLANILGEKSLPLLEPLLHSSAPLRARIIEAMGETKSAKAIPLLAAAMKDEDRRPVIASIEAYRNIIDRAGTDAQSEYCDRIIPLLKRGDFSISSSVVAAFEDTSIRMELRRQHLPELVSFFDRCTCPADDDISVDLLGILVQLKADSVAAILERTVRTGDERLARAAAEALASLTGEKLASVMARSTARPVIYGKDNLALLRQYHIAILSTTRGKIKLSLRADAAPFTVINFILLAKKHFYDHLVFHRVVPNFVIQGGDPEGTGFGGPGYAIRTETYPVTHFTEGAVGMASSGKDTEGSQFFITHCATPHLDGRYTLFAYTRDMDVVDQIQEGDEITSVELQY